MTNSVQSSTDGACIVEISVAGKASVTELLLPRGLSTRPGFWELLTEGSGCYAKQMTLCVSSAERCEKDLNTIVKL